MSEDEKQLWEKVANSQGAERAAAYISLSHIAFEKGDFKGSLAMCETARELYEAEANIENSCSLARSWSGMAVNLQRLGRYREAACSAGEAVKLLRELGSEELGESLREQGRYWFAAGDYQSSLECHQEALEIPHPGFTDRARAVDLLNIGMAEAKISFQAQAIAHILEARNIFKKLKEVGWVAYCDHELATVYLDLSMADELELCARRALDVAELVENKREQWVSNYFLAIAMRLKGEFDEAENLLDISRDLVLSYGQNEWQFIVDIDKERAGIYVLRGKVSAADEILRRVATVEEILEGEVKAEVAFAEKLPT